MSRRALAVCMALGVSTVVGVASADEYTDEDEYEYEYEVVEIERVQRPRARRLRPVERPSTGTGLLIPGGILTGIGVLNLATAPLCMTSLVDDRVEDECLVASLVVGGVMLGVGIPLLAVGASKRAKYLEWRRRSRVDYGFAPLREGGVFVFGAEL